MCPQELLSALSIPSAMHSEVPFTEPVVSKIPLNHRRFFCNGVIITKVQINNVTYRSTLDLGAHDLGGGETHHRGTYEDLCSSKSTGKQQKSDCYIHRGNQTSCFSDLKKLQR